MAHLKAINLVLKQEILQEKLFGPRQHLFDEGIYLKFAQYEES